jgi:hypothetical protein
VLVDRKCELERSFEGASIPTIAVENWLGKWSASFAAGRNENCKGTNLTPASVKPSPSLAATAA